MSDVIPGVYLFRTRIGSMRGLASYAWLEVLPALVVALWTLGLESAVYLLVCHWAVLGAYELGYMFNDRASTAVERSVGERKAPAVFRVSFLVTRIASVLFACALLLAAYDLSRASTYLFATLGLVVLLLVHTWAGSKIGTGSPARIITFGWLAAFKYFPACLAVFEPARALEVCGAIFLLYGAGRVIEYALSKHGATVRRTLTSLNAAWFLCALPFAVAILFASRSRVLAACIVVFLLHHLLVTALRLKTHLGATVQP